MGKIDLQELKTALISGATYTEIAKSLGVNVQTVRNSVRTYNLKVRCRVCQNLYQASSLRYGICDNCTQRRKRGPNGRILRTRERYCAEFGCNQLVIGAGRKYCPVHIHGKRHNYVNYGCRCPACTRANTEGSNVSRARRQKVPPKHGVSGYTNYGCRCSICSAAQSAKNAAYYAQRRAKAAAEAL